MREEGCGIDALTEQRGYSEATGKGWPSVFLRRRNMADEDTQEEKPPPLEQATFEMNEADSEVAHNTIRDAVKDLNGVREVQFVGGGVIVTFNPIGITREEICTAIRRSGYRATEITSSPGEAG